MNEDLLAWRKPMEEGQLQEDTYSQALKAFLLEERDTGAWLASALAQGHTEEACQKIHQLKEKAAVLKAKALCTAAFSLEMGLKGGADPTAILAHFDAILMDTLLAMSAYLNR
ncbi:MAG: histidine kinase [Desulfovibrio sp.]|nr:histidine kinase [Desulfovibrio sp.]